MKKIMVLFLAFIMCVICLCGCNQSVGIGTLSFKHAHFSDGVSSHCVTITRWHNDNVGCEIHTPEGGIFLSEGCYQLFSDETACPYCH